MEKIDSKKLITKYYFLELDDEKINLLTKLNQFKTNEQIDLYIQKLLILILNNEPLEFDFIKINREKIISNFINKELRYSNDYIDNINQIKKLYPFYELIQNKKDLQDLNCKLISINYLLKNILNNINKNYFKININDNFFLLLIDSYLKNNNKSFDEVEEERYQLLIKAKNGDKDAYNKFIESNLKLVTSIAIHYNSYGDFDDLKQCGYIGLIEAYNKFNLELGYSFSTYATHWIKREILVYLNDNRIIKVSRNDYPLIMKIRKTIEKLSNENLPVTDSNIAKETGIPIKQIYRLRKIPLQVDSLDSPIIADEEDTSLLNMIKDNINIEEDYIEKDKKEHISKLLNQMLENKILNERELNILLLHTGFTNNRVYKYEEIGKKYNITRQRVDQIYKQALYKIKKSKYYKAFAEYLEDENLKRKIISPIKI